MKSKLAVVLDIVLPDELSLTLGKLRRLVGGLRDTDGTIPSPQIARCKADLDLTFGRSAMLDFAMTFHCAGRSGYGCRRMQITAFQNAKRPR